MPTKLGKEHCLQQQAKVAVCHSQNCSILYKKHASQPDGQQVWMLHTQVLGLDVNILVNVAVYPAILSCSRSQIDESITDWQRKMMLR